MGKVLDFQGAVKVSHEPAGSRLSAAQSNLHLGEPCAKPLLLLESSLSASLSSSVLSETRFPSRRRFFYLNSFRQVKGGGRRGELSKVLS